MKLILGHIGLTKKALQSYRITFPKPLVILGGLYFCGFLFFLRYLKQTQKPNKTTRSVEKNTKNVSSSGFKFQRPIAPLGGSQWLKFGGPWSTRWPRAFIRTSFNWLRTCRVWEDCRGLERGGVYMGSC